MPGQVGIDALPAGMVVEYRLQIVFHVPMINVAAVQHEKRAALADGFKINGNTLHLALHLVLFLTLADEGIGRL